MSYLFAIVEDESGATAIEYGLLAALLAALIAAAVQALGGNLLAMFTNLNALIDGAGL